MNKYYAGIGSRSTPLPVLEQMNLCAMLLAAQGWHLRSGHAAGADTAFETGAKAVGGAMTIRTASPGPPGPSGTRPWLEHAAQYHPVWDTLGQYPRELMARNSAIMLGDALDTPVRFVVCWTDGGGATGGTGQAIRIARAYGIPVYNLWVDGTYTELFAALNSGNL